MQLLARHGVREYWLVDPDAERIEIHALGDEGMRWCKPLRAVSFPVK